MTYFVGGKRVRHKPSHSGLLAEAKEASSSLAGELDAMIVPASRRASTLDGLIELSVALGTVLVVLCSRLSKVGEVAERVARTPGAYALIVDVPKGFRMRGTPTRTSRPEFCEANGGRSSDLSTKRNLGLLLARLRGWRKIVFVDDDITLNDPASFRRLARQLEYKQIAGMVCRDYPDNSVVCHARRAAGMYQDNFVSGSVLGVFAGDLPLPFFPDIYNEDWFFFSTAVMRHELASVGDAAQLPYKPFADPGRARHEEFGDLLAEGLYTLIGEAGDPELGLDELIERAGWQFWCDFIEARNDQLVEIADRLSTSPYPDGPAALRSLDAAGRQLGMIKPDTCHAFLHAWRHDLTEWKATAQQTVAVGSDWAAMANLGLRNWRVAEYGNAHVEARLRMAFRSHQVSSVTR